MCYFYRIPKAFPWGPTILEWQWHSCNFYQKTGCNSNPEYDKSNNVEHLIVEEYQKLKIVWSNSSSGIVLSDLGSVLSATTHQLAERTWWWKNEKSLQRMKVKWYFSIILGWMTYIWAISRKLSLLHYQKSQLLKKHSILNAKYDNDENVTKEAQ